MKKTLRYYIGIWAILLMLFNVITFVAAAQSETNRFTASFWIGYSLITLTFVGQLFCARSAFLSKNSARLFYSLPLFKVSYIGSIVSFIVGIICMVISAMPWWIGVIACSIVLAGTAIAVMSSGAKVDYIDQIDQKIKVQTAFIRLLTADAEGLPARAKSDAAKAACQKVYEAARYSDPMSSDALLAIEGKISAQMEVLSAAVAAGNDEQIVAAAEEVTLLIGDRNRKCKVLK